MNPIYGNHVGIVINSNPDPEGRGRVQIFVPHLSTTLYQNWNSEAKDISITQGSLDGIQSSVLQRLQQNLPWAECAFPLFGAGGTTYADPSTGLTRTSQKSSAPVVDTTGTNTLSRDDRTAPVVEDKITPYDTPTSSSNIVSKSSSSLLNDDLIKFVISQEGFTSKAAWDYAQWTVGYGTRAKSSNEVITREEAQARLERELIVHANNVDQLASKTNLQLNSNQRNALISYDYNTGKASSIISKVNGNPSLISDAISNGISTAGGTTLQGLVNRRQKEAALAAGSSVSGNNPNTVGAPSSITGKVLDSTRLLPTTDMRTPNGINSAPLPGTFVWCFFLGGDVQKPVYFAGVSEKNSHARTSSIPSALNVGGSAGTLTGSSLNSSNGTLVSGGVFSSSKANVSDDVNFADRLATQALEAAESGELLGNGKDRNGGRCFAGVKTALTDIGVFDSYPSSATEELGMAKNAGILYESVGLSNVSTNLSDIQKGDILVYGVPSDSSAPGHTEIVSQNANGKTVYVSDKIYQNAASVNSSKYVLTGIYRKT